MDSIDQRFEDGQGIRAQLAQGDPSHYSLPRIDLLAPHLKRIVDESLLGQAWNRP